MKRRGIDNGLAFMFTVMLTCAITMGCASRPVGVVLTYEIEDSSSRHTQADMDSLMKTVNQRLGRRGQARVLNDKQLVVNIYGDPSASDLDRVKRLMVTQGYLEFRILADPVQPQDRPIIELAMAATSERRVRLHDNIVAEWVQYDEKEFGPSEEESKGAVKRKNVDVPELLVLADQFNLTGAYLASVHKTLD
jgi:hypothetical protein